MSNKIHAVIGPCKANVLVTVVVENSIDGRNKGEDNPAKQTDNDILNAEDMFDTSPFTTYYWRNATVYEVQGNNKIVGLLAKPFIIQ